MSRIGAAGTCSLPSVASHSAHFALCQSRVTWLDSTLSSVFSLQSADVQASRTAVLYLLKKYFLFSGLEPPSVIPKSTQNFRKCISYRTLLRTPRCTYRVLSVTNGRTQSLGPFSEKLRPFRNTRRSTDSRSPKCKQYRALTNPKSLSNFHWKFTHCPLLAFTR